MTTQKTATSVWTVDKAHSSAEFAVKHLMISTVKGRFEQFDGAIHIDEDNAAESWAEGSVDVASINTNAPDRDAHLRSDDFFNAEEYPQMTFRSRRVDLEDKDHARLTGDLTIRDVTKEVTFDVEFEGRVRDPWGKERAAFTAETAISRKEFNIRWNQALETGGFAVGDKVKITLEIEAVRQDS